MKRAPNKKKFFAILKLVETFGAIAGAELHNLHRARYT